MDHPEPPVLVFSLILGFSILIYGLFNIVIKCMLARVWLKSHTLCVQNGVAMRIVSSIQAMLACLCGAVIVNECRTDKLHARSWLVEPYGFSMTGYLWYDTWAMFTTFQLNHKITGQKPIPLLKVFYRFVLDDPAMMIHHIILPFVLIPVLVVYRRGIGDFYIGMFLFIEAFIPFASLRDILIMLNKKHSPLYILNGIFTVIVYTVCRICLFPFLLWTHGKDIGQPFYIVPLYIPRVCNLGTLGLLSLFLYWWAMVLRIAYEELKELKQLTSVAGRSQVATNEQFRTNEGIEKKGD